MKKVLFALVWMLTLSAGAQQKEWRYVNAPATVYAQTPGSNVLYAGDEAGFIKRSVDKGATWEIVFEGIAGSITDITFLDANHGVATANENATFMTTSDGGLSWNERTLIDSAGNQIAQRFYSAEAVNATTYILNPPYGSNRAFITKDNGLSFKELDFPGTAFHVSGDTLIGLGKTSFFFNTFISYDLGESWALVKSGPSGLSGNNFLYFGYDEVSIINSKTYFMTCGQNNPKGVLKTTDGGISFTKLNEPVNNFFPVYVNFQDVNTGLIGGRISSSWFGFYSTTDGGQTWTPLFNSSPPYTGGAVVAPILELGNNELIAQRDMHAVWSTDGGVSFTDKAEDLHIDVTSNFQRVIPFNKDVWYAHTSGGSVNNGSFRAKSMISEDAGASWSTLLDSANNSLVLNHGVMCPVSLDTMYFAYTKSIGRYIKGGSNSGRLVSQHSAFGGTGVLKILREGNVLLGVAQYFAHVSLDKGETWRVISSGSFAGSTVIDVEFASLNEIYLLTEDNIFKSTDTTKTWVSIKQNMNLSTGATRGNQGITLLKSNEVILFGNDARLYKTTDGGQTWADLNPNLPTNLNFYDFRWMAFRTETEGYAGEPNPNGGLYVLKTVDGGNNWAVYNQGQNMSGLLDMNFADTATGASIGIFGPNVNRYYGKTNYTVDTIQAISSTVTLQESVDLSTGFYPNPSKGIIYLYGTPTKAIKLFNLMGQQVGEWLNPENKVSLGTLKPGVYLIQSEYYNGKTQLSKIVIQ